MAVLMRCRRHWRKRPRGADDHAAAVSVRACSGARHASVQHAVQRFQVAVMDHQPAAAAAAMQHVDAWCRATRTTRARAWRCRPAACGLAALALPAAGSLPDASCCTRCSTSRTDQPLSAAWRASAIAAGRRQRQQRAGMAHLQRAGLDQHADVLGQFQQAQQVGHRRARTADRIGGLLRGSGRIRRSAAAAPALPRAG